MIENAATPYDIEVFYDGGCPFCLREMNALRRWDKHGRFKFTDIDAASFEAAAYGKTQADLMAQMHGRFPDGTWLRGFEVIRQIYAVMGLGWLVALSRLPIVSQCLDIAYRLFAKNRLRLTGRCTTESCSIHP